MSQPRGAVISDEVTPLDLLFDLVYVFAVGQLSHHLLVKPTWTGALETFALLVPVFALWLQTTWTVIMLAAEGRDSPWLLLIILPLGLFMNASIGVAFGWGAWIFVGLYVGVTGVRNYGVVRSRLRPWIVEHHRRMLVWLGVSTVGWLAGAADEPHRLAWWTAAAVLDLLGIITAHVTPWRRMQSEREIIPRARTFERARLFFLIALGETILTSGVAIAEHLREPITIVTGLVALVGTVALWWAYFDANEPASRQALGASEDPTRYSVGTFNLLFGMVAAMIVIAVGDELVIAHPFGHTDTPGAHALRRPVPLPSRTGRSGLLAALHRGQVPCSGDRLSRTRRAGSAQFLHAAFRRGDLRGGAARRCRGGRRARPGAAKRVASFRRRELDSHADGYTRRSTVVRLGPPRSKPLEHSGSRTTVDHGGRRASIYGSAVTSGDSGRGLDSLLRAPNATAPLLTDLLTAPSGPSLPKVRASAAADGWRLWEPELEWRDLAAPVPGLANAASPGLGQPIPSGFSPMRGVPVPNLTPQDVRNVAFNKPAFGRRGYDEEQVDAFLEEVAATITALTEEITSLRAQSDRGRPATAEGSIVAELGEIKVRLTRIEAAIADGGRRFATGDPLFGNQS